MKKIKIKEVFSDDYITREAGERLRQLIEASRARNEAVELDFEGVTIGSTSFFDEAIAKLKDVSWTSEMLKKFVKFKSLHPGDKKVLDAVCALRGWD